MTAAISLLGDAFQRLAANRSSPEFRVTVAYETMSAALWVAEAINAAKGRGGNSRAARLSIWRIDDLNRDQIRARAVRDAASADLLLVALSDVNPSAPPVLTHWLSDALGRKRRRKTIVAALIVTAHRNTRRLHCQLQELGTLARQAGANFVAWVGRGAERNGA